MSFVRLVVLLLLISLVPISHGCVQEPMPVLRVGTNVWPGYETLYLARGLGYFDDANVHLVEYTSAIDVVRSFRNGTIDAAALTLDESLRLSDDLSGFSIILVMDISNGADVIMGRPEIKNLRGLKGRRVGLENSVLGAYMIERALDLSGMRLDEIKLKYVEVSEHEEEFKKGRVDAVVTFEPVRTELLKDGARILFDSSRIPDEIVDVLLVRNDYLANYPGKVEAFLRAYLRAVNYLKLHPEDAARRMAPRLHITEEQTLASFNGMIIGDMKKNLELLSGPRPRLLDTAGKLARVMYRHGLVSSDRVPEGIITSRFVERVNR